MAKLAGVMTEKLGRERLKERSREESVVSLKCPQRV